MEKAEQLLSSILIELKGRRGIMSVREAALYLGTSERSIRRMIQKKVIIAVKIPGIGIRVDVNSLYDYMHKLVYQEKQRLLDEEDMINAIVDSAIGGNSDK